MRKDFLYYCDYCGNPITRESGCSTGHTVGVPRKYIFICQRCIMAAPRQPDGSIYYDTNYYTDFKQIPEVNL